MSRAATPWCGRGIRPCGVDLQLVAGRDKQGDLDLVAGAQGRGLRAARGAVALHALFGVLDLDDDGGGQFYIERGLAVYGDGSDPTRDHLLGPADVLLAVDLPVSTPGERAAYHRAIRRAEAEWPLVEAVARLVVEGPTITEVAVAVGGVARTPLWLAEVEAALIDVEGTPGTLLAAAELATKRCQPLARTGYKVGLLRDTVLEVLERAMAPPR